MSLAERRKAKALEDAVPALAVKLNARSTRGQRISDLQGEDAEADETFWGQGAWQEADDSEFSSEEDEPDKFDDDFNGSESEEEDDEKEETVLRKNERAAKRKRPAGGVYTEPKRFTGVKKKKSEQEPGENGAGGGEAAGQLSKSRIDHHHVPIHRSVRASTKNKTEKSFKEREGEARKAREELLRRTKTQPKKLKGQFTQEQLLFEAVQTEQENMRWILKQQRLEDEAKEDEGRPKSHKALASRWMSRRGLLDLILFPSTFPAVLSQPPALADFDSSGPDADAAGPSKGEPPAGESGGKKEIHLCKITGRPARYRDPLTGFPYADVAAFKELRRQSGPSARDGEQGGDQERDSKGADGKGAGGSAATGADGGLPTAGSSVGAGAGAAGGSAGVVAGSAGSVTTKAASAGGQDAGQGAGQSKKQGAAKDAEKKAKSMPSKGKGKAAKKDSTKSSAAALKYDLSKAEVSAASGDSASSAVSIDTVAANGGGGAESGTPARAKVPEGKSSPAKVDGKEQKGTKRPRKQGAGAKGAKPAKKSFFAPSPAPASVSAPVAVSAISTAASAPVTSGSGVEVELVPLKAPSAPVAYRENGFPARQHLHQSVAMSSASGRAAGTAPIGGARVAQGAASTPAVAAALPSSASGSLSRVTIAAPRPAPTATAGATTPTTPTPAGRSSSAAAVGIVPTPMDVAEGGDGVAKRWENAVPAGVSAPLYVGWQQPVTAAGAPPADPRKQPAPG